MYAGGTEYYLISAYSYYYNCASHGGGVGKSVFGDAAYLDYVNLFYNNSHYSSQNYDAF